MAIKLLDTDTINKIAAGEVIEAPVSVVKELVENAIDAGATKIKISVEKDPTKYIRISDNGSGIEKEDIKKAFFKNATSKISSIGDLDNILSLGFRGEALASIASISQISLVTNDGKDSYNYILQGGQEKSFSVCAAEKGTSITVSNLFFNVPVRKKFLKTPSFELSKISSLVEKFALTNPDISFSYYIDDRLKLNTTGNGNLYEVIYTIYGKEISDSLVEIDEESEEVSIKGFVGKPFIARGNRTFLNYAINGRYIKNGSLDASIEEAYKGLIMPGNYPFTALLFKIATDLLDVNVHPSKKEFRLNADEKVCNFTTDVIKNALNKTNIVSDIKIKPIPKKSEDENFVQSKISLSKLNFFEEDEEEIIFEKIDKKEAFNEKICSEVESTNISPLQEKEEGYTLKEDVISKKIEEVEKIKEEKKDLITTAKEEEEVYYRYIGQLFDTYLLIETKDEFYMMDQHAAHEKILYEEFLEKIINMKEEIRESQQLIAPILIEISSDKMFLVEEDGILFNVLNKIGYEFSIFGNSTVKISAIPSFLPNINMKDMLVEILDDENLVKKLLTEKESLPTVVLEKIASMSCKAAIKGNDRITEIEAISLIKKLFKAKNPYNCPHGRPTLIKMSKYEVEKNFKRIVN